MECRHLEQIRVCGKHLYTYSSLFLVSSGVIERWELLQAQKNAADIKQDLEQWQKLNSDLSDVTSWLGRVLPELERLQRIAPATSIRDIEVNIRKLKVTTNLRAGGRSRKKNRQLKK